MTRGEVIARFDGLYPNPISAEIKSAWLEDINDRVYNEVIAMHENGEESEGLYVTAPYEEYYIHSLAARLFQALGETTRYTNEAVMADDLFSAFANEYLKSHKPLGGGGFSVI